MRTPVVDPDLCTGCELCIDIAPNTFQMDEEGICRVVKPQGDDEETIGEAIDSCPVEAMSWAE